LRSRREIIAQSALGLGGLTIARAESAAKNAITTVKAIHEELDFKASPERIYEALLDSKQFTAFSDGRAAEIHRDAGGTFSIFAGHIVGRNLELIPARRIVQAWRVVPWPAGIYSIARFELRKQGSGTRIVFDHTGFPPELAGHLEDGWQENYWKPLKRHLGG